MKIEEEETISPSQEKHILDTFYYIHKIISRKLGRRYQSAVEDLKQRVFLKLWRWKKGKSDRNLSAEEWQKLAHVAAVNEVIDFFRKKDNRLIPFSQMNAEIEREVFSVESSDALIGNSSAEVNSMLVLVWVAAQSLTLRQKYAYFFRFHDFAVEFITSGCCSIEELAEFFEITQKELLKIIESLPFSDEQLALLLGEKLGGENVAPKQIWEARSKAKARLAKNLRVFFINERLFDERKS